MSKRAVWKWEIPMEVGFTLDMPVGAELLTVQTQYAGGRSETPAVWALVDPDAPRETRRFQLAGTGHRELGEARYVGTFQLTGGSFVGHLFESPFPLSSHAPVDPATAEEKSQC